MAGIQSDSLALWISPPQEDLLPEFVRERIQRGIPATVVFAVELWRDRSGWFDSHVVTHYEQFKLSRDAWAGTYSLATIDSSESADSLSTLENTLESHAIQLPLERRWCLKNTRYWVEVSTLVIPLTTEDLGEVEDWVSGELGSEGGGLLGIPRGLFGLVRDIAGLGDKETHWKSGGFRLSIVASDQLWVQGTD